MNNKNKIALISVLLMVQSVSANEMKNFGGIRFVKIEAGCFQMGQDKQTELSDKDKQTTANELPQHKVCIDKPFYIGESEITQKQWEDVMGNNPSKFKGMYRPVEKVSWNDTQTFVEKLNDREKGDFYRLPTEAEWEYAARAGTTTVYSFGDDAKNLRQYAWFGNEGYGGDTHEVGQKTANPWGLVDMHGNVWEWVQDWYDPNAYKNSRATNPKGAESGQYKIYRGGSWVAKASLLRSATRYSGLPMTRSGDIGFRLVREIK
jgi:formylglycine-generating enzyme required for sulfatase activity